MDKKEDKKCFEELRMAAINGTASADDIETLALSYYYGEYGNENLYAYKYWKDKLCEIDKSRYYFYTALDYYEGLENDSEVIVEVDLSKAVTYFLKAYEVSEGCLFFSDVCYYLGRCFENGLGCEKDLCKALKFYDRGLKDNEYDKELYIAVKNLKVKFDLITEENREEYIKQELETLYNDVKVKKFKFSKDFSKYIHQKRKKIGNQYCFIVGTITMRKPDGETYLYEGGIIPEYYREICKRLGMKDLGTTNSVVDFVAYADQ